MAEQNEGFLDELGIGQINEQAAQQRALGRDTGQRLDPRVRSGQDTGIFIKSLVGAIKAKRAGGKFDYGAARDKVMDSLTERGAGLQAGDLATRREMRDEFNRRDFGDMTQHDNRIRAAQFVAKRARQNDNAAALNASLAQISALTDEKVEYERLQLGNQRTRQQMENDMPVMGWQRDAEGNIKEVGGTRRMEINPETGEYQAGILTSDGMRFFDENFLPEDPNVGKSGYQRTKGADERLRLLVGGGFIAETKDLIQANNMNIAKTARLTNNLNEWGENATATIGAAGKLASGGVGLLNDLTGIVRLMGGGSESAWESGGAYYDPVTRQTHTRKSKDDWHAVAADPSAAIWQVLPENLRGTGEAATLYRAHIMDLAYMAARLAEPSNRGLSDKDIEAALVRIGGSINNPDALKQRIAEMAAEGFMDTDMRMRGLYGSIREPDGSRSYDNATIDAVVGGEGLPVLRQRFQEFLDDNNLEADWSTYSVRTKQSEAPEGEEELSELEAIEREIAELEAQAAGTE